MAVLPNDVRVLGAIVSPSTADVTHYHYHLDLEHADGYTLQPFPVDLEIAYSDEDADVETAVLAAISDAVAAL